MSENHSLFRELYKDRQLKILTIISLVMITYGCVAYFLLSEIITLQKEHGHVHFAMLIFVSVIILLGTRIYYHIDEPKKGVYCEIISLIAMFGYASWGLNATYYSIVENRDVNIITLVIVCVVCACILNYSILLYALYIIYIVCGSAVLAAMHNAIEDVNLFVNYVILAVGLFFLGILRYNFEKSYAIAQEQLKNVNTQLNELNDELKKSNDEVNRQNEELHRMNMSQKLFSASMSHELRNPLNGVMGALRMLSMERDLSKEQMRCVRQSYQSANALLHIVNDLLDYSKMESGEFKIVKTDFDLRDLLEELKGMFVMFARERGNTITYNFPDDLICGLYGDGTRIMQIAGNFVSNAIKYTDGGSIEVEFYVDKDRKRLGIVVKDTGEGMTEDVMKSLFKPYQRVQEAEHKNIKGTGLGLYIVKTLAELMNGTVNVESEYGKGSTFSAEIDIEIRDENLVYKRDENHVDEMSLRHLKDFSHVKALIVDDSKVNLTVAKGLMKKILGIDADGAESGEKCLEIIKTKDFDVILLDHMMPGMDGVETLKYIREINKDVTVVALTANASVEAKDIYEGYGFDDYISKPVVLENLKALFERLYP